MRVVGLGVISSDRHGKCSDDVINLTDIKEKLDVLEAAQLFFFKIKN